MHSIAQSSSHPKVNDLLTNYGGDYSFLTTLFQNVPSGCLELTYIAPKGARLYPRVVVDWYPLPLGDIDRQKIEAMNAQRYGIYFGLAARRASKPTQQGTNEKTGKPYTYYPRGTQADALYLPALYAEVDAKDFGGDMEATYQHIEAKNPSIIVQSGGGYHGYWQLDTLLKITDGNRSDIKRTLKGLAKAVGGDSTVAELARVFRLPGTINTKPGRNGMRCEVVATHDMRYSFDDLLLTYAPLIPLPQPRAEIELTNPTDLEAQVVEALRCIPANDISYGDWFTILAALNHQFGAVTAVQLGEQWSGYCSKPGEVEEKINSSNNYSGTQANVGSIFHIAKQHGYTPRQRNTVKTSKHRAAAPPPPPPEPFDGLLLNQPYVELPTGQPQRCIAVQSDVGTGKTKAAIRLAAAESGKVIYLTHREKLAGNFSEDAARAGVTVELYTSLVHKDWRRASRLAICINSYMTMAKDGKGLPVPDLLIIDEFAQVMEHIFADAGTFKGDEAKLAGEALCHVIQHAGRVVVMDAHLGEIELALLRKLRGADDVLHIRNDYITERGTLTMYEKRAGATSAGFRLIEQGRGVVAFSVASVKRAQIIANDLAYMFNTVDDILLLTAENADGERQRAFRHDPNGEIGKYRALVYSPVIGTGFDITAPVAAVVGIGGTHLSAEDERQMVGRCRAAKELHVWLPETSGELETDPAAITENELAKAQRTGVKLNADGYAVPDVSESQLNYLSIHSPVKARRNASINNLRGRFVELSAGYRVTWSKATDRTLYEREKTLADILDARLKELALTVTPIDGDTYDALKRAGQVDRAAKAGHLRWKIETTSGLRITPELRDKLWTTEQRRALITFTDMADDITALELKDAKEATDGVPLPARRHYTAKRSIRVTFANALLDPRTGNPLQFTKDEFEARLQPIIERYTTDLKRYFGWRPDRCKSAAAIVRMVFKDLRNGLRLLSEQITVNGEHVRRYRLSAHDLNEMRQLACARLRKLKAERQPAEAFNLKTAIDEDMSVDGTFKLPAQATKTDYRALARAGKSINPFSEDWKRDHQRAS